MANELNFDNLLYAGDSIEADYTEIEPVALDKDSLLDTDANDSQTKTENHTPDSTPPSEVNDESGIYHFLKSRGIADPSKINISNEDGTSQEYDFNSLSTEEQEAILNQISDPGISDEEYGVINYLRRNNMTMDQLLNGYAQQQLAAYLQQNPDQVKQKHYSVDDYSDDELYVSELKSRFPDMTDEELLSELDSAKADETLYKKKVDTLRNVFKSQEEEAEKQSIAAQQKEIEDFRNNLSSIVGGFNQIQLDPEDTESDMLEIEDSDKQQIMDYLLTTDSEGVSQFYRDLSDPSLLVELAWFRTQGPKVLADLSRYWKGQITKERNEKKKLQKELDKYNESSSKSTKTNNAPALSGGVWSNVF